ncbi:MAG: S-layer homology domain-containing protein [bacterium JZ-2024 1]
MRKVFLVLSFGLLGAAMPKDVPPGHWAYEAVKRLVEKGWLGLYEDQTFRGDKPVDRFTLASIVGQILKELEKREPTGLTKKDLEDLKALAEEFKDEIIDFKERMATIERKLQTLEEQEGITSKEVTALVEQTGETLDKLQEGMKALRIHTETSMNELNARLEELQKALEKAKRDEKRSRTLLWAVVLITLGVAVSN